MYYIFLILLIFFKNNGINSSEVCDKGIAKLTSKNTNSSGSEVVTLGANI